MNEDTLRLLEELHDTKSYQQLCYDKARAYEAFVRYGTIDRELNAKAVLTPEQAADVIRLGWTAQEARKAMIESQETSGGFLTSERVREQILGRAATLQVVRPRATTDTVGPNGGLGFPLWTGGNDIYPSGLRGYWTGEGQSLANLGENPTLGRVNPPISLWRMRVPSTRSLLEDGGVRLTDNLNRLVAETIAIDEDRANLTGSGVAEPLGILAQQQVGVLLNKDITTVTSGSNTTILADQLVQLMYTVKSQYRANPSFCVTMNSATLLVVRLLKDSSGRYLFDEATGRLCNAPLVCSEAVPSIAQNAFVVLVGAFDGYYTADRLGLSIERYEDSGVSDVDQVVFYYRRRVGGTPGEGWRFAAMKVST